MKRAFSLLELLFVIFVLTIITSFINIKIQDNSLDDATNRLVLYLKQTRYQALLDNKYNENENLWYKERWTLKFFRCSKNVNGIYYSIYSDRNKTGHPNLNESLLDPLTNKRIYNSNKCIVTNNRSKYTLLTKEYNIKNIDISCNNTNSLGQISFGNNGKVYSKLSAYEDEENEYEIKSPCKITLTADNMEIREIIIEPKSGYVYKKEE